MVNRDAVFDIILLKNDKKGIDLKNFYTFSHKKTSYLYVTVKIMIDIHEKVVTGQTFN